MEEERINRKALEEEVRGETRKDLDGEREQERIEGQAASSGDGVAIEVVLRNDEVAWDDVSGGWLDAPHSAGRARGVVDRESTLFRRITVLSFLSLPFCLSLSLSQLPFFFSLPMVSHVSCYSVPCFLFSSSVLPFSLVMSFCLFLSSTFSPTLCLSLSFCVSFCVSSLFVSISMELAHEAEPAGQPRRTLARMWETSISEVLMIPASVYHFDVFCRQLSLFLYQCF